MYNIKLHSIFVKMTALFNFFGMWENEDTNSKWRKAKKSLHLITFTTFFILVALGTFVSDDWNDCIFLALASIMIAVLTIKLFYICWRHETIAGFLQEVSEHSIQDHNDFIAISNRIESFVKFVYFFMSMIIIAQIFQSLLPLFSSKIILPLNIWFPFDWRTNAVAWWIAYLYAATELLYLCVVSFLTVIVWYLMLNCSIKYQILGDQFRKVGEPEATTEKRLHKTLSAKADKQKAYLRDLHALIKIHQKIKELTDRVASSFSVLFLFEITTSGIGICLAIYVLAFSGNENLMGSIVFACALIHNIFDIFMVMYFGNEVKINSDRLSYCLFESKNWMHQSATSKKCFIILAEVLKRPHELVVFKLYRLDLERFTSILNVSYGLFNILKTFK